MNTQPPTVVMLNERYRSGRETGAGIMRNRCAFTVRDMGSDWPESFTYAIVLGWDDDASPEDGAMAEQAAKHGWDDEMITFLREAHERFAELADKQQGESQ
jgi:hypothetical protein